MAHYVAIVEDAGPNRAVGVWFPDLPGCFSAGDTVEEALHNAEEALALYAESVAQEGRDLPPPRSVNALRSDADVSGGLRDYVIALVEMPHRLVDAAQ